MLLLLSSDSPSSSPPSCRLAPPPLEETSGRKTVKNTRAVKIGTGTTDEGPQNARVFSEFDEDESDVEDLDQERESPPHARQRRN